MTLIALFTGCSSNNDMYSQVPMDQEVVGLPNNINVWRDHRGVFYYVDSNGNKTHEPMKVSNNDCKNDKRSLPDRVAKSNLGILNIVILPFYLIYQSTNPTDNSEMIELQCEERLAWENRYR